METKTRFRQPRVSACDVSWCKRALLEEEPIEVKPEVKSKIPKEDESLSPFSDEDDAKRK
jgi:hypothetical protein